MVDFDTVNQLLTEIEETDPEDTDPEAYECLEFIEEWTHNYLQAEYLEKDGYEYDF